MRICLARRKISNMFDFFLTASRGQFLTKNSPHTVRKRLSKLRKPRRASPKIFLESKKKFQIQLILLNPASYFLWNLQISVKSKTIFEIAKLLSKPKKKTVLNPTKLLGVRKYFSKPENLFQPNIYFLVHKYFFKSKKISQIPKTFTKFRNVF